MLLLYLVLYLIGEYDVHCLGIPFNIQVGVDWIKDVAGDFGIKSKARKKKFKDKNELSVARITVGLNSQLTEHVNIYYNLFVDQGDDKGIGGQLNASYKFNKDLSRL